ncbi:MAG: hypothetical protein ACR2NR_06030 [Solirubrobacteraceae bacterium]
MTTAILLVLPVVLAVLGGQICKHRLRRSISATTTRAPELVPPQRDRAPIAEPVSGDAARVSKAA